MTNPPTYTTDALRVTERQYSVLDLLLEVWPDGRTIDDVESVTNLINRGLVLDKTVQPSEKRITIYRITPEGAQAYRDYNMMKEYRRVS